VKFEGTAAATVARTLLNNGPSTTTDVASFLGLTGAAVRKQLDQLAFAGLVESSERAPYGPAALDSKRGRGRPSRVFALTAQGRARFGEHQESLSLSAVKYLNNTAGSGAVRDFAATIAKDFVNRHHEISALATIEERAMALIDALNQDGYAATETPGLHGSTQICQHNCPMGDVAVAFPAICDEETKAFSELTGVHVTRLATMAKGNAVCTTLVPHTRRENA
jgi:predicted ArsR family transcriptional regulator